MRSVVWIMLVLTLGVADATAQGSRSLKRCAPDAVVSGTVCMDAYEASVWRVSADLPNRDALVKLIRQGAATAAVLSAGGATQQGITDDNYSPCHDGGQDCNDLYAVSLPGVTPSSRITWFQAAAACKNSRKRLPTNAEWQAAVIGTPDPGADNGSTSCRTTGTSAVATGSRSACVSSDGASDMVGNLYEWVADWTARSSACGAWTAGVSPTADQQCLAGAATSGEPGALARGGNFTNGAAAGPLATFGMAAPSLSNNGVGFRCAR